MNVTMHGHMNVTMHGHMNVTMHGHMNVTMHGHMNVKYNRKNRLKYALSEILISVENIKRRAAILDTPLCVHRQAVSLQHWTT
jgi:hypothetical protein